MLTDLACRLRSLFRRRRVEAELDDEIRFHLERLVESYVAQGLAPEEARRQALRTFGGVDQFKEAHRDAPGLRVIDDLERDIRHALRQIRRSPGFAAAAVLCLGLGIGVNTTIFSMISAVLLRPIAVIDPDRLMLLGRADAAPWSYPAIDDLRARSRIVDGIAVAFPMESDIAIGGDSAFVTAEVVSSNYGTVVGARLALGRWFADETEPAAVISHAVWERRFEFSPDVLGQRIRSESQSYTVVGVAAREFTGVLAPLRTDLWVPARTRERLFAELSDRERTWSGLIVFGRLRPDTTATQALAELNAIDAQLAAGVRQAVARAPIVAGPVRALPDGGMRRRVAVLTALLTAVVVLVLGIACVNVGNLLLVRGAMRQRELMVRRALGATRAGLVRQLLTESLVLAAAGGVCGWLFAVWANRVLAASVPALLGAFAVQFEPAVDWRAVGFAAAVSIAATALCALAPAMRASRDTALTAMRGATGSGPPRRRPLGLVAQVVMSFVLLFVAGSFLQTMIRLQRIDPGFAIPGRLYAYVFAPSPSIAPEARRELYDAAVDRLRGLPGVVNVATTSTLPLMPAGTDCAARPEGSALSVTSSAVSPGYFETMGVGTVAGRDLDADASRESGVVVSRSLAERLWPGRSAIGERVLVGCRTPAQAIVVGVVADAAVRTIGEPPQPHLYQPLTPGYAGLVAVLVKTAIDPADLVAPIRQSLVALEPALRVYAVQPLGVHIEQRYAPLRWVTSLLTSFGVLALLLAAVGLYGVIAYRVTLRTQEIGVRMALGARRLDIAREVLRNGLGTVLAGVLAGEICTAGITRILAATQEGVAPASLPTHVAIALVWVAVALLACFFPAARAAGIDPLVALRHD